MCQIDIIQSLSTRELAVGLGYLPLSGTAIGAVAAVGYDMAGAIVRAIFWLVAMGLCARWLGSNLEALLRDREEVERSVRLPFSGDIEKQERVIHQAVLARRYSFTLVAGMLALTSRLTRGAFTNIITDAYASAGDVLTVERQLSVLAQPPGNLVTLEDDKNNRQTLVYRRGK